MHQQTIDTYWQEDIPLFEGTFSYFRERNKPHSSQVRAKIHTCKERYDGGKREIVPIEPQTGERVYVMIHPYVEEPNVILTIGMPSKGYADSNALGKVQSARVEGLRHMQIGMVQAWYYIDNKTLILWECFLNNHFHDNVPLAKDPNMRHLWQQIEKHLHSTFPSAERMVTPFSDPLFNITEYQLFLRSLGYELVAEGAYGKLL